MKKLMLYFLLALPAVLAATVAAWEPVAILDTDGSKVLGGRSYYLLPVDSGKGGGLGLASRGDKKCPLDIVQESSEENEGIAVKFSEWGNSVGYVPQDERLRVEMDTGDKICCEQTYWSVDNHFDEKTQKVFVVAGPKTVWSTNVFFLQKTGEGHKFVWCPTMDLRATSKLHSDEGCYDLGIFVDGNGVRRLAFSDEPLVVKFKRFRVPTMVSSNDAK